MSSTSANDLGIAFQNLSVSSLHPPKCILSNVSGYAKKGGITAVFGASSSGKSLLLQSLSSRIQGLSVSGKVFIDGLPVDPTDTSNSVSYVSQHDMLIGDLTAKEMVTTSASLKNSAPPASITGDVDHVLESFGLEHVKDTFIGTIFRAGLSGGQKRRVDVGIEMVAPPSVLLLDEPTSGLDGSIAYDVLKSIRDKVLNSDAQLTVMLAIHQPNSRILDLFDHILVLGEGNMTFFGTVPESIAHFTSIGAPPPEKYTPTDFYLQITDTNFTSTNDSKEYTAKFDFEGAFTSSKKYFALMDTLDQVDAYGSANKLSQIINSGDSSPPTSDYHSLRTVNAASSSIDEHMVKSSHKTTFFTQYWELVKRDFTIAKRDYTLYYLQAALEIMFGFLIGAVFWQLNYRIDDTMYYIPSALLWMCMAMIYIQIFKTYHLVKGNERFRHEYANGAYSVFAFWCAELTVSTLSIASYVPGFVIIYFMVGFPVDAFGFVFLLNWTTAVCAESMLNFVSKFFKDTSAAVVTNQLILVILTAFGGGAFIRWDSVPAYWDWMQVISVFTHSSRALMLRVMRELTYECTVNGPHDGTGVCNGPDGAVYTCHDYYDSFSKCHVTGGEVLYVTQGITGNESNWTNYGYLVTLLVIFRLFVLILMYYPVENIIFRVQSWWSSPDMLGVIVANTLRIRRLEGQVGSLIKCYIAQSETKDGDVKCSKGYSQRFEPVSTEDDDEDDINRVSSKASLVWNKLSLKLKTNASRVLIDNVSGSVECGRVLALMGPSGAG